jgi:hypothetical protein
MMGFGHPCPSIVAVGAKLKTVASRHLVVSDPAQTSVGRSIAGDGSIDREGFNGCFRTLNYLCLANS